MSLVPADGKRSSLCTLHGNLRGWGVGRAGERTMKANG